MSADPAVARRRSLLSYLPERPGRSMIVAAWATLVVQIAIVGTGGLVRLTGSGLGCPTWPKCTADSLVATPEMGIHGLIEFGNRSLTFVLAIIAIVTFVLTLRYRKQRRDLFWLSLLVGMYIPLQAVLGGITVLSQLNPYVVGLHFFASVPLVALSAALVVRVYAVPGPRVRAVPTWYAAVAHVTSGFVLLTVIVGILVTGSGPHAGDEHAIRNGLDSEVLQHIHAIPAYVTFALTVALVASSFRTEPALRLRLWTSLLLAVELVQIAVGLIQANTGLPIALVNVHMVLAVTLVAAMTAVVLNLKRTVVAAS
ncbi:MULTISPECIES: COX15/CtaA family protein [Microbacterium]|jgi:cytochrome c oxidase assembly protein subunit 15|uniref:COX15/CtaA family protein n=1 Tax=Microbacterium TaxID=33882 RepID=UPI0006F4148E|nr:MULTISPECIES: COX15/CtaA family protein [unclassified Microbacterium]MBN9197546.1 heme A synthase [Microbacterium ginsengisoli]MCK9914273.1 COX15/CtaA family protein [Microbacteriaceae bacterium K1510]KQR93203.1 cytochrome oxidase assembly protein [Microbacterium sp. Leaf351]KQS05396.1 cytochrome oxidase assembly protein [Microbacterium sp. Leaf347]ODU73581.1 MAG: cytochrome oxidase assembly protein [Microbacterium sp. SCN 71-21]